MSANGSTRRWRKTRADQLEREPWCACGHRAVEVDHIVPLSEGGLRFDPGNLRSTCGDCHLCRHGKRPRLRIDPETGLPLPGQGHWWSE